MGTVVQLPVKKLVLSDGDTVMQFVEKLEAVLSFWRLLVEDRTDLLVKAFHEKKPDILGDYNQFHNGLMCITTQIADTQKFAINLLMNEASRLRSML